MKPFVIFLTCLILSVCSKSQISKNTNIEKWVHAIINIQCFNSFERYKLDNEMRYRNNLITQSQFFKNDSILTSLSHKPQTTATAILLNNNGKHYLITARHVLFDNTDTSTTSIVPRIVIIENGKSLSKIDYVVDKDNNRVRLGNGKMVLKQNGVDTMKKRMFKGLENVQGVIFSGNDFQFGVDSTQNIPYRNFLNFNQYSDKSYYYYFSNQKDDLAIVSLDNNKDSKDFYQTITNLKYEPIAINDIDTIFSIKKDSRIKAFGFPKESEIAQTNLPEEYNYWVSKSITLPIITDGKFNSVSTIYQNYFEADIFTYHGFSGGPVVFNNKLIGIVHGAEFPRSDSSEVKPFQYMEMKPEFIKSSLILPSFKKLDNQIKNISSYNKLHNINNNR